MLIRLQCAVFAVPLTWVGYAFHSQPNLELHSGLKNFGLFLLLAKPWLLVNPYFLKFAEPMGEKRDDPKWCLIFGAGSRILLNRKFQEQD